MTLTSDKTLAHFDPEKELILACDASPYGLGVVLSHKFEDGAEKPISRTLAPAEKRYSQLDKEGLAIIFGVKRFHQYLVGRHFLIQSDHKPLEHLFKETKGVPTLASARLQRWALTYDYTITYKHSIATQMCLADCRYPILQKMSPFHKRRWRCCVSRSPYNLNS